MVWKDDPGYHEHMLGKTIDDNNKKWAIYEAKMNELSKERDKFKAEVDRLHRVIITKLSENDELGSEYTYVMCLKEEVERLNGLISRWTYRAFNAEACLRQIANPRLTELEELRDIARDVARAAVENWKGEEA